jgi:uncharacterized membrane protein (UPF0127 family)
MLQFLKRRIWFIVASLLAALFLLTGWMAFTKNYVIFPTQNIKVSVEIADSPSEWEQGLMFREKLNDDSGMLFVGDKETTLVFWMKNMKFALDLIFISTNKKVVDIKQNFQPCMVENCPDYSSKTPARYVLEVRAGFIEKNKISIGDSVAFITSRLFY